MPTPRVIHSSAPSRICDIGGWTDTWFAQRGLVVNLAIWPRTTVELRTQLRDDHPRLRLHAVDFGETFEIEDIHAGQYEHDPIIEAAVDFAGLPDDVAVELTVSTHLPDGAGTGASAAIVVATLAALNQLNAGRDGAANRMAPHQLARAAHRVETEMAGDEAGVQDHVTAALGGIRLIEIDAYPRWFSSAITMPEVARWELQRRLVLVYMGRPHDADEMHERVLPALTAAGPDHPVLEALRNHAAAGAQALMAGDVQRFGQAMTDATQAQGALHELVVTDAQRQVMEIACEHNAAGCKQNGAGGEGGSIAILSSERMAEQRAMCEAISEVGNGIRVVPVTMDGSPVRVWEQA